MLTIVSSLSAANILSLSAVSGSAGDTVTIEAYLTTTDPVSALQMTLPLGDNLHYLSASATLGSSQTAHQLSANSKDNVLYVNIFNFSGLALQTSADALFTFRIVLGREPATYTLQPEVLLSNAEGESLAADISVGSVTLLAPKLEILTKSLDYGHIPIRSEYQQTLVLSNVGNEPLIVSNFHFSAPEFSVGNASMTIPAGNTEYVTINYAPVVRGSISETLLVETNAINGQYNAVRTVNLKADPFSVNELHVGTATGISDDTVTVSVRVNNMEPLVGAQFSFTLPTQLEYVSGSATSSSRAASHTASATIDGQRLTLFLYSLNNQAFTGDDGELLSFRLRLNGTSGTYNLLPQEVLLSNITMENMTSATESGYVQIRAPKLNASTSLTFSDAPVTEAVTASLTVQNQGSAPLTISRVEFLAEGYTLLTELPLTLNSWQSAQLQLQFTPTIEGDFSTIMQVYNNDPTNRMHSVALSVHVFEPNTLSLSGSFDEENKLVLSISLKNYTPITGMQFDLHLPAGLSYKSFAATERLANMSAVIQPVDDDTYRALIYSFSNNSVPPGEGAIYKMQFDLTDVFPYSHQTITLSDVYLSDISGNSRLSSASPVYEILLPSFTIIWLNFDGTELQKTDVEYGQTPVYTGDTPQKSADNTYTYSFKAWSPAIVDVTGAATYTATYDATYIDYTITFVNEDETVISSEKYHYGESVEIPQDPTKDATAEYTYTFAGWSPEVVATVSGNATYKATFTAVKNKYTLTLAVNDETMGQITGAETGEYEYGTELTITATANTGYKFIGWSDDETAGAERTITITEDMTLTANFQKSEPTRLEDINDNDAVYENGMIRNLSGKTIYIYGASGQLVGYTTGDVDFNRLQKGVFLLSNGNWTVRVMIP